MHFQAIYPKNLSLGFLEEDRSIDVLSRFASEPRRWLELISERSGNFYKASAHEGAQVPLTNEII